MLQNLSRLFLIAVLVLQFPIAEVSSPEAGMNADTRSSAPSKLCHPKKPVTCRANDLAEAVPSVVAPVEQQAALCIGPKWICRTGTELATPAETLPAAPVTRPAMDSTIESQQAALCIGPKWICRSSEGLI